MGLVPLAALVLSACSADGADPVARSIPAGTSPSAEQPRAGATSPSSAPSMAAMPAPVAPSSAPPGSEGLRIVVDLGDGTAVSGALDDTATARSLLDQLPLTLDFIDFGGQEKIAALPAPLSLQGAPAAATRRP